MVMKILFFIYWAAWLSVLGQLLVESTKQPMLFMLPAGMFALGAMSIWQWRIITKKKEGTQ